MKIWYVPGLGLRRWRQDLNGYKSRLFWWCRNWLNRQQKLNLCPWTLGESVAPSDILYLYNHSNETSMITTMLIFLGIKGVGTYLKYINLVRSCSFQAFVHCSQYNRPGHVQRLENTPFGRANHRFRVRETVSKLCLTECLSSSLEKSRSIATVLTKMSSELP